MSRRAIFDDVRPIFGISYINERIIVNSIHVPIVRCDTSYVNGDLHVGGRIFGDFDVEDSCRLIDGSAASPSLSFISDLSTGVYRTALGEFGISHLSNPRLFIGTTIGINGPLTTTAGPLDLMPAGDVDFHGRDLLNVGEIFGVGSREIAGSGTTIGAATIDLFAVAIVAGEHCEICARLAFTSAAGPGSIIIEYDTNADELVRTQRIAPGIAGVIIMPTVDTGMILLRCTGMIGVTISWSGCAKIVTAAI